MKKIDGVTAEEWADRLFEFENCEECHRGKEGHTIIVFMGNWFARCKKPGRKERLMPNEIPKWIRCYDNGGKTMDRYTVYFTHAHSFGMKGYVVGVGMSEHPFHPQGFGQHFTLTRYTCYHTCTGKSGGKRIQFKDLPPDCQRLVLSDYMDYWRLK